MNDEKGMKQTSKNKTIHLAVVNRVVAVIKPKAPFLAWIHTIPEMDMGDMTLEKLRSREQTVFLLPEFFSLEEAGVHVDRIYRTIFETELAGWWTDPKDWPQKMTVKKFHEWFDVELHSTVFDTTGDDFLTMEY
jgi:hypothetical protein